METTRQPANLAASLLTIAVCSAIFAPSLFAQKEEGLLTSGASAVSHRISQSVERVELLVKSSRILTLDERIPKFQVHNEDVIGATPVSQNEIQIFAKVPGTTQLNLWDTEEKLYTVDVTVLADAREVEGILSSQLPLASLKVMPLNNSAIISGYVTSVDDVDRAVAIVEQFYTTVVNNIEVVGVQQVLLHTRIMEVSRTKLRDLGIDWGTLGSNGFVNSTPGGLAAAALSDSGGLAVTDSGILNTTNRIVNNGDFEALIAALRQQDLVKMLSEPTVVATHGRPARFIVGGSVPYVVPSGNGQVTVAWEEFGTSIDFLPFVVGPGRIRLEVRPEVSEPDDSLSVVVGGLNVPGFVKRYIETAVELQAGQTFAIAGLLQSRTESQTRATPILGEIPYFGSMFRRVRERRNDIELLITVTPELVEAMDPHEVPRGGPGLNSTSPSDHELYVNGHIEVPNMLGSECSCNGPCHCLDGNERFDGESIPATPEPESGANSSAPSLPPGAIVPTSEPTVVGDRVIVTQPKQ